MAVTEENPLVEGLERLPVHPTTLVIFGGDRGPGPPQAPARDLQPRARGCASGGVQPDRGLAVGDVGRRVPQDGARVDPGALAAPAGRAGAREAARACALRGGDVRRGRRVRAAEGRARPVRRGGGDRVQPHLLPLDRPELLRPDREEARRARAAQAPRGRGPCGDREAVRHAPHGGARSEPRAALGPTRVADLPDRPLPGQGDGPEHARLSLRERHVRADLEPQLHRLRADHRGGGPRHREARRVLRRGGCAARPGPEPHAPAAEPALHGAAGDVRRRRGARREGEGPARRGAAGAGRGGARAVHVGHGGGQGRRRLYGGAGRPAGLQDRDLRGPPPRGGQLALGRRADLPAHRQAARPQGHGDRGDAEAGAAPRVRGATAQSESSRTRSSWRCSRTRACRSRSARRSPGAACASGR